jgi:hypothetical protein
MNHFTKYDSWMSAGALQVISRALLENWRNKFKQSEQFADDPFGTSEGPTSQEKGNDGKAGGGGPPSFPWLPCSAHLRVRLSTSGSFSTSKESHR